MMSIEKSAKFLVSQWDYLNKISRIIDCFRFITCNELEQGHDPSVYHLSRICFSGMENKSHHWQKLDPSYT